MLDNNQVRVRYYKFKSVIGLTVIIILILIAELYEPFVGENINALYPCVQNERDSAPCYMMYDILSILIFAGIALAGIVISVFLYFKKVKRKWNIEKDNLDEHCK